MGAEGPFFIGQVVNWNLTGRIVVDLATEGAAVWRIHPVTDDAVFRILYEKHPAVDALDLLHADEDMTNADPEATELFYLGKEVTEGNIGVNVYGGANRCKMKLFVANEDCCDALNGRRGYFWERRNTNPYMCNPNNIVFEGEIEFKDGGLKKVGIVSDGKIVLADLSAGSQRVSTSTAADIIQKQMKNKVESYVDLKPLLEKAGVDIIYEPIMVPDPEDESKMIPLGADDYELVDLSNPSRDDLIKLFSDN